MNNLEWCTGNPVETGEYMVEAFDWVGLPKDKPDHTKISLRAWNGNEWSRTTRYWNTGGMENLEVVKWCKHWW